MATHEVPRPGSGHEALFAERGISFKEILTNEILRKANIKLEREAEVLERLVSYVEKHQLEDFFTEFHEKDGDTSEHSMRVTLVAEDLALQENLSEEKLEGIGVGMFVHDIGKLDIPSGILQSPSELTAEQRAIINDHPKFGLMRLLKDPRFVSAASVPGVKEATVFHHSYKKKAYPINLGTMENLPDDFLGIDVKNMSDEMRHLIAVCAAADSYDALTDPKRVYHATSHSAETVYERMKTDQNLPDDLMKKVASRFFNLTS